MNSWTVQNIIFYFAMPMQFFPLARCCCYLRMECLGFLPILNFNLLNACCILGVCNSWCIYILNCNVFAHFIRAEKYKFWIISILFIITLVSWKQNSYHNHSVVNLDACLFVRAFFFLSYILNGSDLVWKIFNFSRRTRTNMPTKKQSVFVFLLRNR